MSEDRVHGLYRHHKGGLYRVLFEASESTNARAGDRVIIYVSLTTGEVHTRLLEEWDEFVDRATGSKVPPAHHNSIPRFLRLCGLVMAPGHVCTKWHLHKGDHGDA